MLFRLDELKSGNEVVKTVDFTNEKIDTSIGETTIVEAHCELTFRTDPIGYVVKHNTKARVETACVRCGDDLLTDVVKTDWISLRIQQPEENHILLNNAEMNVRFITELDFDYEQFARELIELEIPSYPRHEETDSNCLSVLEETNEANGESSPFDALSKFLK